MPKAPDVPGVAVPRETGGSATSRGEWLAGRRLKAQQRNQEMRERLIAKAEVLPHGF